MPKLVFYNRKKSPKSMKKSFFAKKESFRLTCKKKINFQNALWNFFLNKWVLRYLTFSDFFVPKNCSS